MATRFLYKNFTVLQCMPTYYKSSVKRKFCKSRRPYNTHFNIDLSPYLRLVDSGSSFRQAAKSTNISTTTIHRLYNEWVELHRPIPFVKQENRGTKRRLSDGQELILCNTLNRKIDNNEVVTHLTVQQLATSIYNSDIRHHTRK